MKRFLLLLFLLGCSKPAPAPDTPPPVASVSVAPSVSSAPAPPPPPPPSAEGSFFPPVGTKVTFRGKKRDGSPDTWTATITSIGGGLFQYQPHHDVANFFTKGGYRSDASGIYAAGETLEGKGAVTRVVALPFTAKASAELPADMFSATYTVVAKEKVTVPAGKYDAWKVTVKDKLNPEGAAWLAPGAGIVKVQIPTGRIDELVSLEPPK
jgi:hypothetical protein